MNFKTSIILLVLLAGICTYLLVTRDNARPTGETVEKKNPEKVLDIASGDVKKLTITPADGKPIVLERTTAAAGGGSIKPAASDWRLDAPMQAPADAFTVSGIIDAVVGATSTAQVKVGGSAADYGLDAPQFKVGIDAGDKSATLDIGRAVKAGNELYVKVEGKDEAQVVSADLLDKLDTTAAKLRLTKLLDVQTSAIRQMTIARPDNPLSLNKFGDNWQVSLPTTQPVGAAPTTQPAENSVVTDALSAIENAKAVDFADPGQNVSLLVGSPQATVTISAVAPTTQPSASVATPAAGDSATIEFGAPDSLAAKNVWVRVTPPGVVAMVPKETMDSVLKTALDFRGREVVKIDPAKVTEARVVKNVPATTQPTTRPASHREVVLARRPENLQMGPLLPMGPIAPATAGPSTQAFPSTLPSAQPTTHPTTGPAFASTQPATQPASQPVPRELSKWELKSDPTGDADDAKVTTLLGEFNPLRANKYLAPPPATQPASPPPTTYVVTLTTDGGKPMEILFSDPGESSTQAVTGVYDGVTFEAPRSVITALAADFAKGPSSK